MAGQHHDVIQAQDSDTAYDGPSVDSWSDSDQRIVVSQPAAGFLYDLIMRAKVKVAPSASMQPLRCTLANVVYLMQIDAAPDDVYAVLKDPSMYTYCHRQQVPPATPPGG